MQQQSPTDRHARYDEHGKPVNHYAKIPNELIDYVGLPLIPKATLIKLARHAYGDKESSNPSQLEIAKCLGVDRKSVRSALAYLTTLGLIEPHGDGHQGKQMTYKLRLDRLANMGKWHPCNMGKWHPSFDSTCPNGTHKQEQNKTKKENADDDVTSTAEVAVDPGLLHTVGSCSADEGLVQMAPMFTKKQINEQLLTPNGKLPDDDLDALLCNIDGQLILAGGKHFNNQVLDALVGEHGATYVAFWTSWLLRKIAAEYEAGRPVSNPGGLFTEAVRGHWEVNPSWPEFDDERHIPTDLWLDRNGIGSGVIYTVEDMPF